MIELIKKPGNKHTCHRAMSLFSNFIEIKNQLIHIKIPIDSRLIYVPAPVASAAVAAANTPADEDEYEYDDWEISRFDFQAVLSSL
jgi:hypothetical protein